MIEGFELPWLSEDNYWCRNHKKGRRAGLFQVFTNYNCASILDAMFCFGTAPTILSTN